jgi:hypothetical protein
MRLLLSGEGPTDLGTTRLVAGGTQFVPGPMAVIVDTLLEPRLGYSILRLHRDGAECLRHVNESELAANVKQASTVLPGIKSGKGMGYFTRAAEVLGRLAQADAKEKNDDVLAVFFRDSDGTRAAPRNLWEQKFESIRAGFQRAEFEAGVAMVPRPKSEAWLLCALKEHAYQHCEALEDAPGNDNSPNALKARLHARMGGANAEEQAEWVRSGQVDPASIGMPSFAAFVAELNRAATALGLPDAHQ